MFLKSHKRGQLSEQLLRRMKITILNGNPNTGNVKFDNYLKNLSLYIPRAFLANSQNNRYSILCPSLLISI